MLPLEEYYKKLLGKLCTGAMGMVFFVNYSSIVYKKYTQLEILSDKNPR